MSLWINRMRCKNCHSEINVMGGMVQTKWMGPDPKDIYCPNPSCNLNHLNNFELIGPTDVQHNIEHQGDLIKNEHISH